MYIVHTTIHSVAKVDYRGAAASNKFDNNIEQGPSLLNQLGLTLPGKQNRTCQQLCCRRTSSVT